MKYKNTYNQLLLIFCVISFALLMIFTNGCKKSIPAGTTSSNNSIDNSVEDINVTEKIDLTILYAGLLDTDRAKDFTAFLSKHFTEVKTTDYLTFTGMETTPFDVAIIDHNGLDFHAPIPSISPEYTRATITVGVPGAFLCSQLNLKTGYL